MRYFLDKTSQTGAVAPAGVLEGHRGVRRLRPAREHAAEHAKDARDGMRRMREAGDRAHLPVTVRSQATATAATRPGIDRSARRCRNAACRPLILLRHGPTTGALMADVRPLPMLDLHRRDRFGGLATTHDDRRDVSGPGIVGVAADDRGYHVRRAG